MIIYSFYPSISCLWLNYHSLFTSCTKIFVHGFTVTLFPRASQLFASVRTRKITCYSVLTTWNATVKMTALACASWTTTTEVLGDSYIGCSKVFNLHNCKHYSYVTISNSRKSGNVACLWIFNNGFLLFDFLLTPLTELYRHVLGIKTMTVRKAITLMQLSVMRKLSWYFYSSPIEAKAWFLAIYELIIHGLSVRQFSEKQRDTQKTRGSTL